MSLVCCGCLGSVGSPWPGALVGEKTWTQSRPVTTAVMANRPWGRAAVGGSVCSRNQAGATAHAALPVGVWSGRERVRLKSGKLGGSRL